MPASRTIFRVAALVLLLLTGGELFGCEILFPNGCESDRVPGSQQTQSDDCCICCCVHIVVAHPIRLDEQRVAVAVWTEPDTGVPTAQPFQIYHPPKA